MGTNCKSITEAKAIRRMGYPVLQKQRKKKQPNGKGFEQYKGKRAEDA
jgi:hypothetical protein